MTENGLEELLRATVPTLLFLHRSDEGPYQRIGILSGSFNPPTVAHLRMAEMSQEKLSLDHILLLLAVRNVDKVRFDFSIKERAQMMTLIARSRSRWSAVLCSHGLFVEKALAVRRFFPEAEDLFFIVGQDTLSRIFDDRFYPPGQKTLFLDRFFDLAHLAVFARPSLCPVPLRLLISAVGAEPYESRIHFLEGDASFAAVSSTMVRARLREDLPIDDLVPEVIADYLKKRPFS